MPTDDKITKIKNLAAEGKSVNSIKDKLNMPKSTVYYHFKKEVGQKQKENKLKIPEKEEVKGEICGAFAGDGNYYEDKNYKYRVKFTLNINENYWKELSSFLKRSLEKKPRINHQEDYNRTNLRYESKTLINFLRKHLDWDEDDKTGTVRLNQKKYDKHFKIGFLRGLFDTDGFIAKNQNKASFNSISKNLTEDVSTILKENEIEHGTLRHTDKRENCRDMYRAKVTGDKVKDLIKLIKPRHPKKKIKTAE